MKLKVTSFYLTKHVYATLGHAPCWPLSEDLTAERATHLQNSCAIILSTHPAPCQRPGTGQPGSGGAGTGGASTAGGTGTGAGRTTTPPPTTTNPTNDRTQNPFDLQNRPIFLSGKVVMDDGTPPPEPVVIERVCNSVVRGEAYTDSKGRFSFQLGQNTAMIQEASSGSALDSGTGLGDPGRPLQTGRSSNDQRMPTRNNDLIGCEIRASLPGFRSDLVNLVGRRSFDNPEALARGVAQCRAPRRGGPGRRCPGRALPR